MQKRLDEDVATGDLSVVLIASLAAATVLLIIVLTGVAVKCKRENKVRISVKEIRSLID